MSRSKVNLKKQGGIGSIGFTTMGPTPNRVDLGVSWDDLSIGIIKTVIFSRNSQENPSSKPIGRLLINIDQSGFSTDFGSFIRVRPTPNGVDLGVSLDDLSIGIIKIMRFSCYLGGGEDHMKRSHFVCLFICLFRGKKRFSMVSDS